jgi:hypothetical protein
MSENEDIAPAEDALASRLSSQRPVPGAGFRGALSRRLSAADPGYGPRPSHLVAIVAMYLGTGGALLVLGLLVGLGKL